MDKKELKKMIKSPNVNVADDSVYRLHKSLIKDILAFFNHGLSPFSFHSDDSNLASVIGIPYDSGILGFKYKKYIIDRINEFVETPLTVDDLDTPLKEILPTIKIKPHNYEDHPLKPFLGIKSLTNEIDEDWSFAYYFGQKSQVDYFEGWTFGKDNPLNGDEAMKKRIMDDHQEMKRRVYGVIQGKYFKAKTIEGDELIFKNIYEVCNWLTARASNYVPGRKQSW